MANEKKIAPKLSADIVKGLEGCATTSAKIRYLASQGISRADIARIVDQRYQHVRNVLITPIKG